MIVAISAMDPRSMPLPKLEPLTSAQYRLSIVEKRRALLRLSLQRTAERWLSG